MVTVFALAGLVRGTVVESARSASIDSNTHGGESRAELRTLQLRNRCGSRA